MSATVGEAANAAHAVVTGAPFGPPDLEFRVEGAGAEPHAATPCLRLNVAIEVLNAVGMTIQSLALNAQVRIAAPHRRYSVEERKGLRELFGLAPQWSGSLRSLLWAHAEAQVPRFEGRTVVALRVPCTYDFEVIATKYLHALSETGAPVPLELLFSGTMFYDGASGLQVARIAWEKEARFEMPVALWKETMERYYPNSAWLRVRRDMFDRLYRYRVARGLLTWEATLEALLAGTAEGEQRGEAGS